MPDKFYGQEDEPDWLDEAADKMTRRGSHSTDIDRRYNPDNIPQGWIEKNVRDALGTKRDLRPPNIRRGRDDDPEDEVLMKNMDFGERWWRRKEKDI